MFIDLNCFLRWAMWPMGNLLLFYDGAVNMQIWALLTRSPSRISDTRVTIKVCGPLVPFIRENPERCPFWSLRESCTPWSYQKKSNSVLNGDLSKYNEMVDNRTRGPQALTVTWVSETLHWLLVKRAHICISTAPS